MKEKLIAFTRNKKNYIWMIVIIAILVLPTIIGTYGINIFSTFGLTLELIIRTIILLATLLWFAILKLFKVDEKRIRNNNFFILLLSIEDYIWIPILTILHFIYLMTIGILGIAESIIAMIILAILSFLLATIVSSYFSKKIK